VRKGLPFRTFCLAAQLLPAYQGEEEPRNARARGQCRWRSYSPLALVGRSRATHGRRCQCRGQLFSACQGLPERLPERIGPGMLEGDFVVLLDQGDPVFFRTGLPYQGCSNPFRC